MALINLFIVIIVAGILLWLVNLIPMPGIIKTLLNLLVLIVLIIYVLEFFGLIEGILPIPVLFSG